MYQPPATLIEELPAVAEHPSSNCRHAFSPRQTHACARIDDISPVPLRTISQLCHSVRAANARQSRGMHSANLQRRRATWCVLQAERMRCSSQQWAVSSQLSRPSTVTATSLLSISAHNATPPLSLCPRPLLIAASSFHFLPFLLSFSAPVSLTMRASLFLSLAVLLAAAVSVRASFVLDAWQGPTDQPNLTTQASVPAVAAYNGLVHLV